MVGSEEAQNKAKEVVKARSNALRPARSGLEPGGPLPVRARVLLSMQSTAGNRAVTSLVRRWPEEQQLKRLSGTAVQRRRKPEQNAFIPSHWRVTVPKADAPDPAAYAEREYTRNLTKGKGLMDDVRAKAREAAQPAALQSSKESSVEAFELPSSTNWEITPSDPRERTIKGFGISITYKHRSLKADEEHAVEFGSDIKRNAAGRIELKARSNYAVDAEYTYKGVAADDARRGDNFLKMKLNDIWAHQIAYFQRIEQTEGTKFLGGAAKPSESAGASVEKITRSRVENPSTLFTYWLTDKFNSGGHVVADEDDRLALLGSPNGWSIMFLLKAHPEMLAGVDPADKLIEVEVQEGNLKTPEPLNMMQTVLQRRGGGA